MKPRFTDTHRFGPNGYVRAAKTDIAATFRRIRREMAEREQAEVEAMKNVKHLTNRRKA